MQVLHCLVGVWCESLLSHQTPTKQCEGRLGRPSHFQTFAQDVGRRQGNAQPLGASTIPPMANTLAPQFSKKSTTMGRWSEGCQKFEIFCGLRTGVV